MSIKKSFYYTSIIFLALYVLRGVPDSLASPCRNEGDAINQSGVNNLDDHSNFVRSYLNSHPDFSKWDIEVDSRIFQISVDRENKIIIVSGEADDYKVKEDVEAYVKVRAPGNFQIIYDIDVINSPPG